MNALGKLASNVFLCAKMKLGLEDRGYNNSGSAGRRKGRAASWNMTNSSDQDVYRWISPWLATQKSRVSTGLGRGLVGIEKSKVYSPTKPAQRAATCTTD